MNTQDVTATVATLSIVGDLGLHFYNFGLPNLGDAQVYRNAPMTYFAGTVAGVASTAVVSGIASEELKGTVDTIPDAYKRTLARGTVASAFLPVKVFVASGVVLAHSLLTGQPWTVPGEYFSKQLAPSLVLNSLIAFTVPYFSGD